MMAGRPERWAWVSFDLAAERAESPLKDARKKRDAAYGLVVDGIDPIEERKARKAKQAVESARALTFKECAVQYIAAQEPGWKSAKHAAQWTSTLETYAYPIIGSLPVASINKALVLKVLNPIWSTKTETASRVRGRIEKILDWARSLDLREGENPAVARASWTSCIPAKSQVAPVEHHPASALSPSCRPSWRRLQARRQHERPSVEFTILTAAEPATPSGRHTRN